MKEKMSISKEIAKVALRISAITLTLALVTLMFVYYAERNIGYAVIAAACIGGIALILLSLILPIKTSAKISSKINTLDLDAPYSNETYSELDELIRKTAQHKKDMAKKLNEMSDLHKKQDTMRRDFTANFSHVFQHI